MEVALRSSRTRTTVPSSISRRTIGSSASERVLQACVTIGTASASCCRFGGPAVIAAHANGSSIQLAINTTAPVGICTLTYRPCAYSCTCRMPDADLAAKPGMPAVMNFQFLPDMGRMDGQ